MFPTETYRGLINIPTAAHEDLARFFTRAYLHDRAKGFRVGGIRRTKNGHDTQGKHAAANRRRRVSAAAPPIRTDPMADARAAAERALSLMHAPPRGLRKLWMRAALYYDAEGRLTHLARYRTHTTAPDGTIVPVRPHEKAYDEPATQRLYFATGRDRPVRARLPIARDDWQTAARITRYYLASRQWRDTADEDKKNTIGTGRSLKRPPPIGSAAARGDDPSRVAEWTAERAQTPLTYVTQPPRRPPQTTYRITSSRAHVVPTGERGTLDAHVRRLAKPPVTAWTDRPARPATAYRMTQRQQWRPVHISPTDAAEILGHGMPAERVTGWQRVRGGVAHRPPSSRVTKWIGEMRTNKSPETHEPGIAAVTEPATPRAYRRTAAPPAPVGGYRPVCCRCRLNHGDIVTPCCSGK